MEIQYSEKGRKTMINYFRMKKNEWKLKGMLYGIIVELVENQKDIIAMIQKLYISSQDTSQEDFQKELVKQIASLAHDQVVREREAEKEMS